MLFFRMVTMINKRKIPPITNPVILIKRNVDSIPYAGAKSFVNDSTTNHCKKHKAYYGPYVQGGGIEIKDLSLHTVMKHNILYNSFP